MDDNLKIQEFGMKKTQRLFLQPKSRFQAFQVQVQLIHGSTSARQEIKVWLDGTDGRRRCVGYPITFFGDGFAGTMTDVWHVGYYL